MVESGVVFLFKDLTDEVDGRSELFNDGVLVHWLCVAGDLAIDDLGLQGEETWKGAPKLLE